MTHEDQFRQALMQPNPDGAGSITHGLPDPTSSPEHPSLLLTLHKKAAESLLLVQPASALPTLVTTTSDLQMTRSTEITRLQVKESLKKCVRMETKES